MIEYVMRNERHWKEEKVDEWSVEWDASLPMELCKCRGGGVGSRATTLPSHIFN